MLEDIWRTILDLMADLVIPDWGAVILLLPIVTIVLVIAILLWVFLGLFHAPAARRGKSRIQPMTPDGIHMPGPTFAPILAAFGAFTLFLGLVFGGLLLYAGLVILAITLLYWMAEALRTYDHDVGATVTPLPVVIHDGPPPGVHMPGPSFRPFIAAFGTTMVMLGLVFGVWLLVAGLISLVVSLLGWLVDARKEYVKVVEADTTGHLENIPAPRAPTLLIAALLWLLVGAAVIQLGWIPPRDVNAVAPPAEAESPGASAPAGGPPPSAAPTADIVLTAHDIQFDTDHITGPAGVPFTIALINDDAGTPHNLELKGPDGAPVWKGEVFTGIDTRVYDAGPLPPAEYTFLCTVHPTMTGTATIK
jgi:Cupredoxin-like domain/Cytochrome c oxidase subunit IV